MPLKVVYIAGEKPNKIKRERKLTAQEILHQKALESLAATKIADRERAKKRFAPERERLNKLLAHVEELRKQCADS